MREPQDRTATGRAPLAVRLLVVAAALLGLAAPGLAHDTLGVQSVAVQVGGNWVNGQHFGQLTAKTDHFIVPASGPWPATTSVKVTYKDNVFEGHVCAGGWIRDLTTNTDGLAQAGLTTFLFNGHPTTQASIYGSSFRYTCPTPNSLIVGGGALVHFETHVRTLNVGPGQGGIPLDAQYDMQIGYTGKKPKSLYGDFQRYDKPDGAWETIYAPLFPSSAAQWQYLDTDNDGVGRVTLYTGTQGPFKAGLYRIRLKAVYEAAQIGSRTTEWGDYVTFWVGPAVISADAVKALHTALSKSASEAMPDIQGLAGRVTELQGRGREACRDCPDLLRRVKDLQRQLELDGRIDPGLLREAERIARAVDRLEARTPPGGPLVARGPAVAPPVPQLPTPQAGPPTPRPVLPSAAPEVAARTPRLGPAAPSHDPRLVRDVERLLDDLLRQLGAHRGDAEADRLVREAERLRRELDTGQADPAQLEQLQRQAETLSRQARGVTSRLLREAPAASSGASPSLRTVPPGGMVPAPRSP